MLATRQKSVRLENSIDPGSYSKGTFLAKCSRFSAFQKSLMSMLNIQNPYMRVLDPPASPVVQKNGKSLIMLGSNNYLSLSTHPDVLKAAKGAIDTYGTGTCSSRLLSGTTSLHVQLEQELSRFKDTEDTLLYSTGYMTMMGTLSTLAGEDDVILSDQLNHASIIDGIRLSKAQARVYKHSDMTSLEEHLASCPPDVNKLIVTDGVFSMKGDIANLPEIKRLADDYGALVMVDDAHGTGVLGKNGHGILEHFNMENQVDLVCCTFSKVFGSVGGAVGARKEIIDYLRFNSRPFLFTASSPPSVVATVLAALQVLERSPQLLRNLRQNVNFLRKNLKELGFKVTPTQTPIIPLLIGNDKKAFQMASQLEEEGIFVNPVVPPAVSAESSLIRISVMAALSQNNLERAIEKFKLVGKRLDLI